MHIEIHDESHYLTFDFGSWLISRIQYNFNYHVDLNKLQVWDEFFESSADYNSIGDNKISTLAILQSGLKNLICQDLPDKLIIRINPNQFVIGLDRVKVDQVCRLINFGNTSIKGYPIFTELFNEIVENINEYVDEYERGL